MAPKHHVEPLFTEEQILARINELANQIAQDYADKELMLVGVLDGGAMAAVDLGQALWKAGLETVRKDYIGLSSYGDGTESTGHITMTKELKNSLRDRHVLVVDDIVDTGRSLQAVLEEIRAGNPASIATFAILSKPSRREVEIKIDYLGFEIPNTFVVGYGLDYEGMYRTMPGIGAVVFD